MQDTARKNELQTDHPSLNGEVAIVTGGGRGLGRAFAQALARAGAAVVVAARTESELDETARQIEAEGGTVTAVCADVSDPAAVKKMVTSVESTFGPVDILINNAAVLTPLGYDWEVDAGEWWRTMEINVRGPFLCTQAVLPGMMTRRSGRIINVSSGVAYTVHPHGTAYCASKAALSHMTRLLAAAVKEHGIVAFAFGPSGPSAMIETLAASPDVPQEVNVQFKKILTTPGDRTARSVDMLMLLLSGRVDALTGRHIEWDDDADILLQRADAIVRDDLYTVRRIT